MFLQACVCPQGRGVPDQVPLPLGMENPPPGMENPPRMENPPPDGEPPPDGDPLPRDTATAADGTHPTGMHSCFGCFGVNLHIYLFRKKFIAV